MSLGFFCGVAQETEHTFLRSFSGVFDWVITESFERVLDLIESGFVGFLDEQNLLQEYGVNPAYYYDEKYKIHFYHDFSAYKTFESQIAKVKQKYNKRIHNFLNKICEPTLFIRYCSGKDELKFIDQNYDKILKILKQYNSNNNIIFLFHEDYVFAGNVCFFVLRCDKNDTMCRKPFHGSKQLNAMMGGNIILREIKEKNKLFYKKHYVSVKVNKLFEKVAMKLNKVFRKPYKHKRIYYSD